MVTEILCDSSGVLFAPKEAVCPACVRECGAYIVTGREARFPIRASLPPRGRACAARASPRPIYAGSVVTKTAALEAAAARRAMERRTRTGSGISPQRCAGGVDRAAGVGVLEMAAGSVGPAPPPPRSALWILDDPAK